MKKTEYMREMWTNVQKRRPENEPQESVHRNAPVFAHSANRKSQSEA